MLRFADPTECAMCALSFFCRPGSRADSAPARLSPARLSRCALGRGAPQSEALHRLRCAALAGAAPAAQRSLGHITGRAALLSGAGPGAARPSRRSLSSTTSTNACVRCVYERPSEEISQTAPSLLCAQQPTELLAPSAASAAASGPTVGMHAPRPRCAPRTHTRARARTHARKHTLTCTATHTWAAAVADGLRAAQPLAEQAAKDEDKLSLFVTNVVARAEELRLRVGAPTYAAAGHYLKVARSAPCFVRLLAATGPASCHGRCLHCSVMIGI